MILSVPKSWHRVLPETIEVQDEPGTLPENSSSILKALEVTPFDAVKVVILGQDPYPQKGMANGLAFAVNKGIPRPSTLRNIMKEVESDLGIEVDQTATTLMGWAKQGVLLLNTALTVEQGKPGSHTDRWRIFTKMAFQGIVNHRRGVIFMLWGTHAASFASMIHYGHLPALIAAHPSPQAQDAFFGCRHFSEANRLLKRIGKEPIDWSMIDNGDD